MNDEFWIPNWSFNELCNKWCKQFAFPKQTYIYMFLPSLQIFLSTDSKKTFLSTPVKMPESDTDTDISVSRDEDSSFNEKSATESDSSSGCEFKPSPPRQSLRSRSYNCDLLLLFFSNFFFCWNLAKGKRPTRRENEKTVHSLERKSERVRNSSKKTPKV